MRDGRGVGDLSRFLRIEFERDRLLSLERLTLSFDFERRSEDPLRLLPSRSVLKRPRSRDLGRSFSFESSFLAGLRLLDLDCRRLRLSPPLLEDEDDEELKYVNKLQFTIRQKMFIVYYIPARTRRR